MYHVFFKFVLHSWGPTPSLRSNAKHVLQQNRSSHWTFEFESCVLVYAAQNGQFQNIQSGVKNDTDAKRVPTTDGLCLQSCHHVSEMRSWLKPFDRPLILSVDDCEVNQDACHSLSGVTCTVCSGSGMFSSLVAERPLKNAMTAKCCSRFCAAWFQFRI